MTDNRPQARIADDSTRTECGGWQILTPTHTLRQWPRYRITTGGDTAWWTCRLHLARAIREITDTTRRVTVEVIE